MTARHRPDMENARRVLEQRNGSANTPAIKRFRILTDEEIEDLPAIEYVIADVLPEKSLAEVHGPPGDGKSFWALDTVMCVASGRPFHGREVRRGSTVYIAAEGSAGIGQRTRAWKYSRSLDGSAGVWFITQPVNLLDPLEVALFIGEVRQAVPAPIQLVVFDTFHRCFSGGDENSSRDVGVAIAAADKVRSDLGCCVLLVHHTRKDGESERGSTALRGAVDAMFAVKKDDDNHVTVSYEKMKDAASLPAMEFTLTPTLDSCVLTIKKLSDFQPTTISENHRKAIKSLSRDFLEDGATSSEWLIASSVKQATYYRVIKELVTWGYVDLKKQGRSKRYTLTDLGRDTIGINSQITSKQLSRGNTELLSQLLPLRESVVVEVIERAPAGKPKDFEEVDI